jgi:hypothetical protein
LPLPLTGGTAIERLASTAPALSLDPGVAKQCPLARPLDAALRCRPPRLDPRCQQWLLAPARSLLLFALTPPGPRCHQWLLLGPPALLSALTALTPPPRRWDQQAERRDERDGGSMSGGRHAQIHDF